MGLVVVVSPERLRRARALQSKLLDLIVAARAKFFKDGTHRETSLMFQWIFPSSEYDGFPSEAEEINEVFPLPQKIVLAWPLDDIDECNEAIDKGFVKIMALTRSLAWKREEIYKYLRIRMYDFIESSLGRSLGIDHQKRTTRSPIKLDEHKNFYRWKFSKNFPQFLKDKQMSNWPAIRLFELNNALDTGALTIVEPEDSEACVKSLSSTTDSQGSWKVHHTNNENQTSQTEYNHPVQNTTRHSLSGTKETHSTSTNVPIVKLSQKESFKCVTDSSGSSPTMVLLCEHSEQASRSKTSYPAALTVPKHNSGNPSSQNIHREEILADAVADEPNKISGSFNLTKLCSQAWTALENENKANGSENHYALATLKMGLTHAIQLKEQIGRVNTLEHENSNLQMKVLQLEHDQEILRQQISTARERDEKEISNARLEGEKIAEQNVARLWNMAKERGRVSAVFNLDEMYKEQGYPSILTTSTRIVPPSQPLLAPTIGTGRRDSGDVTKKIPTMCADESRSHLPKARALCTPSQSDSTSVVNAAPALSVGLIPTITEFEKQNFCHWIPITNASVQIPPTPRGFHKSFLNHFFGPIKRTLNNVPSWRIPNSVKWTNFFVIHLETQPYIFSTPNPLLTQTYGQLVHFISGNEAELPRAAQGTTYPTLLQRTQSVDQYYYIGHFVVSSVVTTTDFDELLKNMPEMSEADKYTKHQLLDERSQALSSAAAAEKDLPVDFYTLQYVFFGDEQNKILLDAQDRFDALKAANNTIDSLLEANDRDKSLSSTGQVPNMPAAMRNRHPSSSETETLPAPNHHNSSSSPLFQVNKAPSEPAAMTKKHISSGESEGPASSNHHKATGTPLPPPDKSRYDETTPMKRKYPSGTENQDPREGSTWKIKRGPAWFCAN